MSTTSPTNNERLRHLIEAAGLTQMEALATYNDGLSPGDAYARHAWKTFLTSPFSQGFRPFGNAALQRAEQVFGALRKAEPSPLIRRTGKGKQLVGYARQGTVEDAVVLEGQLQALRAVGCKKVFQEQIFSTGKRAQRDAAFAYLREGDVLVVTQFDRLARTVVELMDLARLLEMKAVTLCVLDLGMDPRSPADTVMQRLLLGIAQLEENVRLERLRESIQKAKDAGKYKGRKPLAPEVYAEVTRLNDQGMSKPKISAQLGISQGAIYRFLRPLHGRQAQGKPPRTNPNQRPGKALPPEVRAEVARLNSQGESKTNIAKQLGVSRNTVHKFLKPVEPD